MLVVKTIARIRREHFIKGKTIKEIACSAVPFCASQQIVRKGAVRKRTQLKGKVMAKAAWTKRDKTLGEFMTVMKNAKKFKGMGREKAFKSEGLGAGASGSVFGSPPAPRGRPEALI